MIPKNIFWLESELARLQKRLLTPNISKETRRRIKDKIRYREKMLKRLREQLEIDIMDMEQFRSLGRK